ncbi:MAG TPA: hypothetical protein VNZ86_05140 [Bacteroidia bacterium]|nr:hypothetical protein [Bacteroidia bacterium]
MLLYSCSGSPKNPAELVSADSLCHVVSKLDSACKHTDTLSIRKTLRAVTYNLAYIQLNRTDTLSREEGYRLARYNSLKKPLLMYLLSMKEIKDHIEEEKKQCENLAHDLRHNTLAPKLDARTCLNTEMRRVAGLCNSAGSIFPALKQTLIQISSMDSSIVPEVGRLKSRGGKEPVDIDKLSQSGTDND